jgi:ABC-type nitrate/sulfonate/bicarbonate transport system substrate-binding protein
MSPRARYVLVDVALATTLACPTPARPSSVQSTSEPEITTPTEPPPLRHLTVVNTSLGSATAFFVAQDVGIFARHGLDVEIPLLSGVKSVQVLVARQAEYGLISARTAVDARLAGAEVVMIAGVTPTLVFGIFAASDVAAVSQLRGKAIGITQVGGSADFAARYALRQQGLEADRDYALFQTGGMAESLAALESGGLRAAVLSPPTTVKARKAGLQQVLDITALEIDYVSGALATNQSFLREEPETDHRFLKALLEGIHYAKTNPTATKQVLARQYQTTDPEVLDETYALFVDRLLPRVPYVSLRGVQTVLDEIATSDAGRGEETARVAALASPEQFVDRAPLAELEASGFVVRLWGD